MVVVVEVVVIYGGLAVSFLVVVDIVVGEVGTLLSGNRNYTGI